MGCRDRHGCVASGGHCSVDGCHAKDFYAFRHKMKKYHRSILVNLANINNTKYDYNNPLPYAFMSVFICIWAILSTHLNVTGVLWSRYQPRQPTVAGALRPCLSGCVYVCQDVYICQDVCMSL